MLLFKDMCWINLIVSEVVVALFLVCKFKDVAEEISKAIENYGEAPGDSPFMKITLFAYFFSALIVIASAAAYIATSIPVSGACVMYNHVCCHAMS